MRNQWNATNGSTPSLVIYQYCFFQFISIYVYVLQYTNKVTMINVLKQKLGLTDAYLPAVVKPPPDPRETVSWTPLPH